MTDNCTCADHGTFRTTDPECPIHGTAEMKRRHEAARRAPWISTPEGVEMPCWGAPPEIVREALDRMPAEERAALLRVAAREGCSDA